MARVFPAVWTRQPQISVGVNRLNPLTRGLVVHINPAAVEALSNTPPTFFGTAARQGNRFSRIGFVADDTANDAVAFALAASHPLYSITTEFTLSVWIEPVTDTSYTNYLSVPYRASGWTTPYNSLVFYKATGISDKTTIQVAKNSSEGVTYNFSSKIVSVGAGSFANYVVTVSSTRCEIYKNGGWVDGGSALEPLAVDWGEKRPIVLLNSSDSSLPNGGFSGFCDGVDIWNRALSSSEIWQYFRNRFSLDAPLSRQIWVGPSAATGIPTLSAATAINVTQTQATPQVALTF